MRFGGGDDEGVGRNRRRIRIRLLERKSPKIVDAFKEFGRNGVLGTFYRSEAVPEVGAIDNYGDLDHRTLDTSDAKREDERWKDAERVYADGRERVRLLDWRRPRLVHSDWISSSSGDTACWGIVEDDESLEGGRDNATAD